MTNEEANSTLDPITIVGHLRPNEDGESIDVRISYEIIRLFSEGLYQSPHKAIEELVTNSFDADADRVFVLIPRPSEESSGDSLWVIDDGFGMDKGGFTILWRVADSTKYGGAPTAKGRLPIGQFGIGKLAAYVLAWRLTHVSKVNGSYYYTSMDFHRVTTHHQYDEDTVPLTVGLHEIEEDEAKMLLGEIQDRDSTAWAALFGPNASPTWTAAALSDFKDLYGKLRSGRLSWVLRTSIPLTSNFSIYLNGEKLEPALETSPLIEEWTIGGPTDADAAALGLEVTDNGVIFPGITGEVTGNARLFRRTLAGKSDRYGRSRGFFY